MIRSAMYLFILASIFLPAVAAADQGLKLVALDRPGKKRKTKKASATWKGPTTMNREGKQEAYFLIPEEEVAHGDRRSRELEFTVTKDTSDEAVKAKKVNVGKITFPFLNGGSTWTDGPRE